MKTYRLDYTNSDGEPQCTVIHFDNDGCISDIIASYLLTTVSIDLPEVDDTKLSRTSYVDYQFYGHLFPYISFIQNRFKELTEYCVMDIYEKDGVKVVVNINSHSLASYTEVPTEAFQLVRWFNEIQDTRTIPEDLLKYIEEQEAKELLRG